MKHCDQCGNPLGPTRKRFCKNSCKDTYHNIHNPRGYYAPGRFVEKDTVLRGLPTNLSELLKYKSMLIDHLENSEHGDKDYN